MTRQKWFFLVSVCFMLLAYPAINGYAFSNLKSSKPDSIRSYDKAHNLYKRGKYQKAENEYKKFLKGYPDSLLVEPAIYYTAKSYAETKDYNNALVYYKMLTSKYKKDFWTESAKKEIVKIQNITVPAEKK